MPSLRAAPTRWFEAILFPDANQVDLRAAKRRDKGAGGGAAAHHSVYRILAFGDSLTEGFTECGSAYGILLAMTPAPCPGRTGPDAPVHTSTSSRSPMRAVTTPPNLPRSLPRCAATTPPLPTMAGVAMPSTPMQSAWEICYGHKCPRYEAEHICEGGACLAHSPLPACAPVLPPRAAVLVCAQCHTAACHPRGHCCDVL